MDIKEVRKKFPQYNDLSDTQLADALHAKFYSDIPKDDFYGRIGLTQPKPPVAPVASAPVTAPAAAFVDAPMFATEPTTGLVEGADYSSTDPFMSAITPPEPKIKPKSVLEGVKAPPPLPTEDPMIRPEFVTAMERRIGALPAQERAAALANLTKRPDVYGRAARVVQGRMGVLEAQQPKPSLISQMFDTPEEQARKQALAQPEVSPLVSGIADPRLEAQVAKLVTEGGMEAGAAEAYARQELEQGRIPRVLSMMRAPTPGEVALERQAQQYEVDQTASGIETAIRAVQRIGKAGELALGKAGGGMQLFLGEMSGADVSGVKDKLGYIAAFNQAMGENPYKPLQIIESAGTSIVQQLPALVAGAITGSQPLVLASMYANSFGDTYADGRERGLDKADSTARAAIFGAFEVLGEKFGLGASLDLIKGAAKGKPLSELAGYFAKQITKEIPGEQLTYAGQFATDKGFGLNPEAGIEEFLRGAAETAIVTATQAGMMLGGAAATSKALRAVGGVRYTPEAPPSVAPPTVPPIPPAPPAQKEPARPAERIEPTIDMGELERVAAGMPERAEPPLEGGRAPIQKMFDELKQVSGLTAEAPPAEAPPVEPAPAEPPAPPRVEAPPAKPLSIEEQIRALEEQQKSLLTKAGKVPAVKSPARKKYDALGEQINALRGQVETPAAPEAPAPTPPVAEAPKVEPPKEAPAAPTPPKAPTAEAAPPVAPALTSPEVTRLQAAYDKAKASLDAIGSEPAKPSSESRYFGSAGREGAAPEVVKAYDEKVKAYNSWRRKYSQLKKAEVEASNALFRAKQAKPEQLSAPKPEAPKEAPAKEAKPPLLDESNVQRSKKPPEQGGRHPQVQAAAMLLEKGQMTREEYEKYVDAYRPIYSIDIDKMYPPSTPEKMRDALRGDVAKSRLNTPIADGTRVGLRMDLPALDRGVPVVSIHEGKPNEDPRTGEPYASAGDVIGYGSTGYIKDVFFAPRSQEKSLKMGYMPSGKNPLQTAEGKWVNMSPEQVLKRVKELKDDPAWTQVGFDPHRHGYFYDRKTRQPVAKADEMFQIGNFLLAKNVQYAPKEQFLYSIEPESNQIKDIDSRLPVVKPGEKVDGLIVREDVPNMSSIAASLENYQILPGIRAVPINDFGEPTDATGNLDALNKRTRKLAELISESNEINPLIVVYSGEGNYILEGAHRIDALDGLGKQTIPAVVVIDQNNPPILYSIEPEVSRRTPLGFYSALANGIEGIKTNAAPVSGWKEAIKGLVNKGAVKADEVEWSGVNDWLDLQQGKVTKEDLLNYLRQNGVQVEETVLGGRPSMLGGDMERLLELQDERELTPEEEKQLRELRATPKFGRPDFVLPGGENYREVLLRLPEQKKKETWEWYDPDSGESEQGFATQQEAFDARPNIGAFVSKVEAKDSPQNYRSPHWDQPNVIAHIRMNDRTDADGNKVLFVEEIQSDWGQEGKRGGFYDPKDVGTREEYLAAKSAAADVIKRTDNLGFDFWAQALNAIRESAPNWRNNFSFDTEEDARIIDNFLRAEERELRRIGRGESTGIPAAPFVTKTEGWLNLALKRIMVMAAEGGYDKVAFVNGEQSAERYDLSKQVNRVRVYRPQLDEDVFGSWIIQAEDSRGNNAVEKDLGSLSEVEDYVGKEVAQRLITKLGDGNDASLSGLDLKVGGEGMKTFYDQIVPLAIKKLLPKVGGDGMSRVQIPDESSERGTVYDIVVASERVADRESPIGSAVETHTSRRMAEQAMEGPSGYDSRDYRIVERDAGQPMLEQPGFDVTPAMREKVETTGLPLFSLNPSINIAVTGNPSQRSPSFKREVAKLKGLHTRGLMSDEVFAKRIDDLIEADARRRFDKQMADIAKGRVRGADWILEKLRGAKRKGEISDEAYKLAEWFINGNPRLVEELGISIVSPGERGVAGQYDVNQMIMVLVKGRGNDLTAVHEILHHLERMMPPDIQAAIRKEWTKQLLDAKKKAKTPQEKLYYEALMAHHFGEGRMSFDNVPEELRKLYTKLLAIMDVEGERVNAMTLANHLLKTGGVDRNLYQYYSPSEFWAVNGSDIVRGRYDAIKGGLLTRLKNWLRELGEKIKSIFGLKSEAALIRALDSLAKADGKFVTKQILDQTQVAYSIEPDRKAAPKKMIEPATIDRLRESWTVGRDELGRRNLGPGAKAYDTVARITNVVLDKILMKPISPELGRAMRNMKVEIDKAQKKVATLGKELSKLSSQERELISDVIEGELKADVIPPQHIIDIAASMVEIMSAQGQEMMRLGMLSKEAFMRWENKYLPRFYLNNLGKEAKAWATATKRLLMKQPTMQGIKGQQLKSRGMYQQIYTEDLPDWIAQGWEQRDADFNPKTSVETVVWRDYTREEREEMGEIRDAMFRFVMGYNASQRDIALGRLYESLSENYASKSRIEGYVKVPETMVEGTNVNRYGKLAGMYVPKEIMDHLVWNDKAMSNGLYKLYQAGLGRWKEGKTVLNPTAHANNVFSNFTMAHFAGVSYWDVEKYAGALKDFVTNDEMLKEAEDIGLFTGTFSQTEMVENMPAELKQLANMTGSQLAKYGDKAWDLLSLTLEWDGKKYGVRPMMKWMYENEDFFFRYLIYRDARNRGMEPEDAREYSNQFIFTYDDLPVGARVVRDIGMPFFSYTYKVVPVLARTALEYPWRFAAPAAAVYTLNALMYSIAASVGGDEDDWWGKTLYKYVTDKDFRQKANQLEEEERKNLPSWMKGKSSLGTEKAIRLGMDDITGLPLFLDISRIFPGGDLLDAENNAGGFALLQPLTPSNPVLTSLVAMLANKDMFLGKDVVLATDTDAEKARKRAAWLWKQWAPAISVGNYHFDRGMNTIANMTGKPITVDAGPMGVIDYTGVGKDGLPVIPKYAALQTFGVKVRPYDLEVSAAIEKSKQDRLIKELAIEIKRINRLEEKGSISPAAAELLRSQAQNKQELLKDGLTVEGKPKK